MNNHKRILNEGDVIEFTLRGERRTAEAMLVTADDIVLLDLFDGDRPVWARLGQLEDVAVYLPEAPSSAPPPDEPPTQRRTARRPWVRPSASATTERCAG